MARAAAAKLPNWSMLWSMAKPSGVNTWRGVSMENPLSIKLFE
jgi:hypothetical protein